MKTDHPTFFPTYRVIDLTSISIDDTTYSICPEQNRPSTHLTSSIGTFGILHPPLLHVTSENKLVIVSGRKRILAVRQAFPSLTAVPCLVFPEEISPETIFPFLLQHALIGSSLSLVEQALFFNKCLKKTSLQETLTLLAVLGHKPQKHQLDALLEILELENTAMLLVHRGILSPKIMNSLKQLSHADQKAVSRCIEELNLGGSKQQRLLEFCHELTKRSGKDFDEIIEEWRGQLPVIDQANKPQIAGNLFQWLHRRCYPGISLAEQEFAHFVAGLTLPNNVKIRHTASFEDNRLELLITCNNRDEVSNLLQLIGKTVQ